MKSIVNPAWTNAPFQMNFVCEGRGIIQDTYPHRFNIPWPDDICADNLWAWIEANSIPRYLTVDN